ncbi:MAG: EAL domain-containing protein [Treponema sp.]|nr:EAL domain-containing protein [Treponema sp.]
MTLKTLYALIFAGMAAILAVCIFITFISTKKKIACVLRSALICALVPTLANVVILLSSSSVVCGLAYALFYATINWILTFVFCFCLAYTSTKIKYKWMIWVLYLVTLVDSVLMLSNLWTGKVFSLYQLYDSEHNIYFLTQGHTLFKLHLFYSYFLSVLSFATLIVKICMSAPVYWRKYLIILASLLVVVLWDALFVVKKTVIDKSIVGFGICSILLTYFALIRRPWRLINSLLGKLFTRSSSMVFFFDADGECVYANTPAKEFFSFSDHNLNACKEPLREILKADFFPQNSKSFTKMYTVQRDEKKIYLRIEYKSTFHRKKQEGVFYSIQDCTDDEENLKKEKFRSEHDELTGTYKSEVLYEKVEKRLRENPDVEYYLIVTDIKDFKLINDVFGKEEGDRILVRIASCISELNIQDMLYGRLSGDCFGFMMRRTDYEENLRKFWGYFNEISNILKDRNYSIVIHAGIYRVQKNDFSVSTLFDRARLAISTIKGDYKNGAVFYDDSMRRKIVWERQITGEAESALKAGQFNMFLQPQVDADGVMCGAEALVRWNHHEKGLLPPSHFIKTFENNGLVSQIDLFMWELACRTLQKWKRMGRGELYISVNISSVDFYYVDVFTTLSDLVTRYNIEPKNLRLEVTEGLISSDLELKMPVIERLRMLGFVIVMDDFGSGSASLNILKDLPMDGLKLDMDLMYRAKDVERSKTIMRALIGMARELGIEVVGEGVGSRNQVDFLKSVGCSLFQGYFFAKPVSIQDFENNYLNADRIHGNDKA